MRGWERLSSHGCNWEGKEWMHMQHVTRTSTAGVAPIHFPPHPCFLPLPSVLLLKDLILNEHSDNTTTQ